MKSSVGTTWAALDADAEGDHRQHDGHLRQAEQRGRVPAAERDPQRRLVGGDRAVGERPDEQEEHVAADPGAEGEEERREPGAVRPALGLVVVLHADRVGERARGVGDGLVAEVGEPVDALVEPGRELLGAAVELGDAATQLVGAGGELAGSVVRLGDAGGELRRRVGEPVGAGGHLVGAGGELVELAGGGAHLPGRVGQRLVDPVVDGEDLLALLGTEPLLARELREVLRPWR